MGFYNRLVLQNYPSFNQTKSISKFNSAEEIDENQESKWGDWFSWSACSKTCGDGTRTRLRACQNSSFNACTGESVESEACNDGLCPKWSDWSDWSDCSASCDGGTQSRTRQCQNGEENDCRGAALDEQQCNRISCDQPMVYWNSYGVHSYGTHVVRDEYLPYGETFFDRCVSYCLSHTGCIAVQPFTSYKRNTHQSVVHSRICYMIDQGFSRPIESYRPDFYQTVESDHAVISLVVKHDYYISNPHLFNVEPEGFTGGSSDVEIEGLCDEINTGFGMINYRNLNGIEFTSKDDYNVIRVSDSVNCAVKCFETAGCSAFFVENGGCTYIIGNSLRKKNDAVTDSGILSNGLCPTTAFENSFIRRGQMFGLIFAPHEAEDLALLIRRKNGGIPNNPFHVWRFDTQKITENSMLSSSQFVSVSMPDMYGPDKRYRPIIFRIETHIRIGQNNSNRKRRSTDRESELIKVDDISSKTIEKIQRQIAKEQKKANKDRFIMPRTADILAEIEVIEQQATSFILDGEMNLPDDTKVAAMGQVEIFEFVQTAADGSIAADCSSGSCKCSIGFIDNGNGCEEMTEEQAATTQAPSTPAPTTEAPTTQTSTTTTVFTSEKPNSFWISSLVNKMETVFANTRSRHHLLKKWKNLSEKFVLRHQKLARNGCIFSDTYENDSIDFDSVNECRVSKTLLFVNIKGRTLARLIHEFV